MIRWTAVALTALAFCMAPGTASALAAAQGTDTLTLERAVRLALELDPEVAGAEAGAEEAAAGLRVAEATRFPSLSSAAQAVRFEEPMVVAPIHALDLANAPEFDRTLIQGRLDVDYTLWDGGGRSARISGARATGAAGEAALRSVRQEATAEVVEAYLEVLTARDVVTAQEARLA